MHYLWKDAFPQRLRWVDNLILAKHTQGTGAMAYIYTGNEFLVWILNVFTGRWNESQNISMQIKMSRTNKLSANGQVRSMLPNERGKYKVVFLTVLLMEGQDRCWWKHPVCRQEENDELHMRLIFISRYWWRTPWWNINVQSFRSWLIDWWRNVVLDTLRLRCTENGINLQAPYRV